MNQKLENRVKIGKTVIYSYFDFILELLPNLINILSKKLAETEVIIIQEISVRTLKMILKDIGYKKE